MSRGPAAETLGSDTHTRSILGGHGAKEDRSLRRAYSSVSARSRLPGVTSAGGNENTVTEVQSTTYSPPDDHGLRLGDLLNRAGSDSLTPSSASSIFSTTHSMSYTGRHPSLHALTPLTSTDSSPPGKLPSPRSAKPSHETMYATPHDAPSSAIAKTVPETITPVHTPPEARISIWPSDGKLGQRLYYDPMLDEKLDSRARRAQPTYKDILEKVHQSRGYG